AERRDGVVLPPDLRAQLGDLLGALRRLVLDLVDIGGRQEQRRDHADIEEADHRRLPLTTSASAGSRGTKSCALRCAGASVRSAARSLAERARGLAAISASSGVTGRPVRARNEGAGAITSGRCREPPPRLLRSARKVLTMRSSSE